MNIRLVQHGKSKELGSKGLAVPLSSINKGKQVENQQHFLELSEN